MRSKTEKQLYIGNQSNVDNLKSSKNEGKHLPLPSWLYQGLIGTELFIQPNRRNAIEIAIEKSSKVDKPPKQPRRSKQISGSSKASSERKLNRELSPLNLRRSGRFQRTLRYAGMETSGEQTGCDSDVSDSSLGSSGSVSREDEDDDDESSSDENYASEDEALEAESSDEETIRRKCMRLTQPNVKLAT